MSEMLINVINVNPDIAIEGIAPGSTEKSSAGRRKRIASVVAQSKQYGLSIRFWEGVVGEKLPCENINKAHKQIVADAKLRGLKSVCVAEDDFILSAHGAWEYFIGNTPENYDLYLGGVYSGTVQNGRIMNGWSGLTLYVVHERFYDFFLDINPVDHIDRALGNFCFEKMYRVCEPYCVYQLEGYSDNHRRDTRHRGYLEKMKSNLFGR